MAINSAPEFNRAFRGYNRSEVDNYIRRLEADVEIAQIQQEKKDREIEQLKASEARARALQENAVKEAADLRSSNQLLQNSAKELEKRLQTQADDILKLQNEIRRMKEEMSSSDRDPEAIKYAILNAQRMGDIILREASQESEKMRLQAETEQRRVQEENSRMMEEAQHQAAEMVSAAEEKCTQLQKDYDRILMDVSGFKAEMIAMYRKHMELLYHLPDDGRELLENSSLPVLDAAE